MANCSLAKGVSFCFCTGPFEYYFITEKWSGQNRTSRTSSAAPVIPRPLPPEERPGTHCLRMRKIFHYIFCKKLHALTYFVSMRKIVLTNDTELSLKSASSDLTCRILLDYYFSDVAVSCFNNLQSNRKVKNQFAKKGHVTTETFISLRTRHVAALF